MNAEIKAFFEELGEKSLENIPDLVARGWSLPLPEELKLEVANTVSKERFRVVNKLVCQMGVDPEKFSVTPRAALAARIPNHDQGGLALAGDDFGYLEQIKTKERKIEFCSRLGIFDSCLRSSTQYRAFSLTIAYLALDGNPKYTAQLPLSLLPAIIYSPKYDFVFEPGENDQTRILTPEYVALLQIIKNAPVKPTLRYHFNNDQIALEVADQGAGIKDREGQPLALESLGQIFGNFTTKSQGGLGLQIAKELVHLRGGYIVVETKSEGHPARSYSTLTEVAHETDRELPGTTFTVNVPRIF